MATHHDQAICIRHWDFSDTSQTVGMFCRTTGIVRGIAKGARRERGSFSGGMDLLTMGELSWIEARSGDLCTLTSWLPTESWPALRTSPRANTGAWYVLECIGRMLEPHDPHPELFDGLVETFHGFARGDVEASMVRFLWSLLGETGFRRLAALNHAGVAAQFSYVSTAGGAFLEWMEGKALPGVVALERGK